MAFDYYFRNENEEDLTIQVVSDSKMLSVRVDDDFGDGGMIMLTAVEVDRLIAGLQAARKKMKNGEEL